MKNIRMIRRFLLLFMIALFLSGVTAIPVEPQLRLLLNWLPESSGFYEWVNKVLTAYSEVQAQYPFLLYGYDWLAFAHFVLSILFIGPYYDPVRNIWVIQFGLIACILVVPYAFILGYFRGIPIGWRLIDCSFGVFGFGLLMIIYIKIKILINQLNKNGNNSTNYVVENKVAR